MRLDRQWIATHLPHRDRMCLLEEVLAWDTHQAVCRAVSHRAHDNPLRSHGRLAAICGVEYAAQATAVHGALQLHAVQADASDAAIGRGGFASDTGARFGLLASARAVALSVPTLDQITSDLVVRVRRLYSDPHGALYGFVIEDERAATLMQGRLSVLLDAARASAPSNTASREP